MDKLLFRINQLYKKSKEEGLTPQELQEQQELRSQYIKLFRDSFKKQLENTDVKYDDGEVVPLTSFKKPDTDKRFH